MRLLVGLAWDVAVLLFDALVPGRRTEREAWLEASASYMADCQALRDAIGRLEGTGSTEEEGGIAA
jgi:hypothetical protein